MDLDFELFLVVATFVTGIVYLLDIVWWQKKRTGEVSKLIEYAKLPKLIEYAHSFFPILLIVLVLRSFLVEPFHIPSGSLEPTLLPGDYIVANKFIYGLRLPVSHTKIVSISEPRIGDIVIFRMPGNPGLDLIKRVVGVEGTRISYVNKVLYLNGVEQPQTYIGDAIDYDEAGDAIPVQVYREVLNGVPHLIYINPAIPAQDSSYIVPPGHYFMMGDNRDDSEDSRYWGFASERDLVGKAFIIMFSWDSLQERVRWQRLGERINVGR